MRPDHDPRRTALGWLMEGDPLLLFRAVYRDLGSRDSEGEMSQRSRPRSSSTRRFRGLIRPLLAGVAAVVLALAIVWAPTAPLSVVPVPTNDPSAQAASNPAAGFNAGYIISDANFYNGSAWTSGQIQDFLEQKVPHCHPEKSASPDDPIVCMRSFRQTHGSKKADRYCKAISAAKNESAASIIARVGRACSISPKVMLVLLQKETGLVTHTWPSSWRYERATGYACPDSGPGGGANCNSTYYGFFNQVYYGARTYQVYRKNPTWYNYRAGMTNRIQYDVPASCGRKSVYIRNDATAGLYIYTPYTPNSAALKAGWGTGNSCSSYGNRNFYAYYKSWFGSPTAAPKPSTKPNPSGRPKGKISVRSLRISGPREAARTLRADPSWSTRGVKATYQWYVDGRKVPSGSRYFKLTNAHAGHGISVTAYGSKPGYTSGHRTEGRTGPVTGILRTTNLNVSGSPVIGARLTAHTTANASGTRLQYIWLRDGRVIHGSNSWRYTVTRADAGHRLSFRVTASKTHFRRITKVGPSIGPVLRPLESTPRPTLSGKATVGGRLHVQLGSWQPAPQFHYRWRINGRDTAHDTGTSFQVPSSARNKLVSVRVVATRPGYHSATRVSVPVKIR